VYSREALIALDFDWLAGRATIFIPAVRPITTLWPCPPVLLHGWPFAYEARAFPPVLRYALLRRNPSWGADGERERDIPSYQGHAREVPGRSRGGFAGIVKDSPEFAEAYFNLGLVREEQGRHEEAITNLAKALALNRACMGRISSLASASTALKRPNRPLANSLIA